MLITRFDRHENNGYGKSRCTSLRRTTCSSDSLGLEFLKSKKCIGLAEKNADLAAVTRSLEFTIPYPVWLISLILFSPFCFFFFFQEKPSTVLIKYIFLKIISVLRYLASDFQISIWTKVSLRVSLRRST